MFEKQLKMACRMYNLKIMENLSDRIHDAESKGYNLTRKEESLWQKLTDRIQGIRKALK